MEYIQNWKVAFNLMYKYNTIFKFIRAKTICISFLIRERLSWGCSRKFSIEWVITTLFEVTEYSQNRSYEVSIGFLGCGSLKNNIDMAQWLNWSETPDPSTQKEKYISIPSIVYFLSVISILLYTYILSRTSPTSQLRLRSRNKSSETKPT